MFSPAFHLLKRSPLLWQIACVLCVFHVNSGCWGFFALPWGMGSCILQQFRASRDNDPSLETVSTEQKKRHCILRERHNFFFPFMQVARTCKTRKTINLYWKPLTFAYVLRVWVCILPVTPFLHSLDLVYCLTSVYSRLFCNFANLCWVLGIQGQISLRQHWWICRVHMEP